MTTGSSVAGGSDSRLATFIRENTGPILAEWDAFALTIMPAAERLVLRDHAKEILDFVADDIETYQTKADATKKSHGEVTRRGESLRSPAQTHALARAVDGFNIVQMVSEYRALRASVIGLWTKGRSELLNSDLADLTRFNEAIDQALAESVASFTEKIERSRNLFLGILGHDIRNPLGAILMSAELIQGPTMSDAKKKTVAARIAACSLRIAEMVDQLIDLTRIRLGTGMEISVALMDIGALAKTLVEETKARFPEREILLTSAGDTDGDWDHARLGQVFSNLLGNAVEYSAAGSPISVFLLGEANDVRLTVHNEGVPISRAALPTLFDSFVRAQESDVAPQCGSTNLGLGLYIAKEIVLSHGGTITVTSSASEGTAFVAVLPKNRSRPLDLSQGSGR